MRWLCLIFLTGMSLACASEAVDVRQIMSHDQCQQVKNGASRISEHQMAQIRGSRLLSPPGDQAPIEPVPGLLYSIYAGPKSTAGYSLELKEVSQTDQSVQIHLSTQAPAADMMVSQVITHPCAVIQIQGLPENYRTEFFVDGKALRLFQ